MSKTSKISLIVLLLDLLIFILFANHLNIIFFLLIGYLIPVILMTIILQIEIKKVTLKSSLIFLISSLALTAICDLIISTGIINIDTIVQNSQILTNKNLSVDVTTTTPTIGSFISQSLSLTLLEILIKYVMNLIKK